MDEEVTGAPEVKVDYDRAEMARLTRIALRGRRIRSGAKEMGLGESTVSKLARGKLESRPSVDTLRKLNTGNPPELFSRMLEACQYSQSVKEEMDAFARMVNDRTVFENARSDKVVWNVNIALATVVDGLTAGGYGSRFVIDYRADDMFAIDMGEEYPLLICIPLVLPGSEILPKKVAKLALEKIKQGIEQWGVRNAAIMVLTNSPSVYQLLKQMPNRSKVMAVAVSSEDGRSITRQYTILPIEPSTDKPGKFPVDLSIFGDELMIDI